MKWHQSTSSQIQQFAYDPTKEELTVHFRTGGRYCYSGVNQETFDEFKAADSHGKFLHSRIKRYHHCEKVLENEIGI